MSEQFEFLGLHFIGLFALTKPTHYEILTNELVSGQGIGSYQISSPDYIYNPQYLGNYFYQVASQHNAQDYTLYYCIEKDAIYTPCPYELALVKKGTLISLLDTKSYDEYRKFIYKIKNPNNEQEEIKEDEKLTTKQLKTKRFISNQHKKLPFMVITDTLTNKSTLVPFYAYGGVLNALEELFN